MITKQFKDNAILINNFSSSIFGSHYFTSSWLKRTELEDTKLIEKIEYLHFKDGERDMYAKRVNFILCFNIKDNEIYLIHVDEFLKLSEEDRVRMFTRWWDFYIPRSIWFKSFCMLNSKDIPILANELINQ